MEQMFKDTCKELNLQPVDCFFEKIVQTYEMMIVRHGFMMVQIFGWSCKMCKIVSQSIFNFRSDYRMLENQLH